MHHPLYSKQTFVACSGAISDSFFIVENRKNWFLFSRLRFTVCFVDFSLFFGRCVLVLHFVLVFFREKKRRRKIKNNNFFTTPRLNWFIRDYWNIAKTVHLTSKCLSANASEWFLELFSLNEQPCCWPINVTEKSP